ncbi:hypothetical protein M406DRAFT_249642 [Cryphonectria parasitica EP155]|uniref:Uncharacterized protein n=1 Tax=Cryphonectria parasitica (strain ATCC 38755 / EP155) TaxID=660469 RepID=A0A9P4Y806_CRYP1|nr:uncharacterized protein M406DRAFT_249642 [Cryphonectria parasitica EP155]KAF3768436.1 hypothetical protein M406DRAFT_249642 [Cryphonectria parasitica EP155]
MSNRVDKPFSKKTEQRNRLFLAVDQFGFEIMLCTACASRSLVCKMMDDTKRCSQCIRRARSCDGCEVPVSALSRIMAEDKKLESKEREAEAKFEEAHRRALEVLDEARMKISESAAHLARLRTQRKSLASRGAQMVSGSMVNAGLESLDELDEQERREEEERNLAASVREVVSAEDILANDPLFGGFDWNSVNPNGAVVDYSGFLQSRVSEASGSRSGAERSS